MRARKVQPTPSVQYRKTVWVGQDKVKLFRPAVGVQLLLGQSCPGLELVQDLPSKGEVLLVATTPEALDEAARYIKEDFIDFPVIERERLCTPRQARQLERNGSSTLDAIARSTAAWLCLDTDNVLHLVGTADEVRAAEHQLMPHLGTKADLKKPGRPVASSNNAAGGRSESSAVALPSTPPREKTVHILDTREALAAALATIEAHGRRAALAIDLEGVDLGRVDGKLSVLQLISEADPYIIYLVDVTVLGEAAFSTPSLASSSGVTLKSLIEDPAVEKLMWDCRSDNSALLYPHGVELAGVVDLQLHNLVWQWSLGQNTPRVAGLGQTLEGEQHSCLSADERAEMKRIKAVAKQLFSPSCGGSYEVWDVRPLAPELVDYCSDARTFFALRRLYRDAEARAARALRAATARRLIASSELDFHDRTDLALADRTLRDDVRKAFNARGRAGRGGRTGGA